MTQLTICRHPGFAGLTHDRPFSASRRPRLRLRLQVWLKGHELDAALARGADPAATDELILRARQLARPDQRARLADAVEELVELADGHTVLVNSEALSAATSLHRQLEQIRRNRPLLLRLVNRLREERPVDVHGLAQLRCLLSDDRGPLYHRDASPSLEEAVAAAIAALDPSPGRDPSLQQGPERATIARTVAGCTSAARPNRRRGRARGIASAAPYNAGWRSSASSRDR